jgi:hypothetical protein
MDLNTIRDETMNKYLKEVIDHNQVVKRSKSQWESKTLLIELLNNDDINHIDFYNLLLSLLTSTTKHLEVEYLPSKSRGKLCSFIPVSPKAIEEADKGRKLEVPLERALALANNWFCQFSCLSGYANTKEKYKRKSIDLVWTPSDSSMQGYLIELKEWKSKNHILFACIEIIIYWICFVKVRSIDIARNNPQASIWPNWSDFKLCVMAPYEYFAQQPKNYGKLVNSIDKALQALSSTDIGKCNIEGVNSCSISTIPLNIDRSAFIEMVRQNATVLTSIEARQSDIINSSILCHKLE